MHAKLTLELVCSEVFVGRLQGAKATAIAMDYSSFPFTNKPALLSMH